MMGRWSSGLHRSGVADGAQWWRRVLLVCGLVLLTGISQSAPACAVPVFRYALERWIPEPYQMTIFHQGPLDAEGQRLMESIETLRGQPQPPNLEVTWVDVDGTLEDGVRQLWQQQRLTTVPWAVLSLPARGSATGPVWSGAATSANLLAVIDSPVRRELVRQLVSGATGVWVLVASGDAQRDADAETRLMAALRQAEQELKLPASVAEEHAEILPFDQPGATSAVAPLRITFPVVRLARHDPAEAVLVSMLEHSFTPTPAAQEPFAVAVFGRGRALHGLVGNDIEQKRIAAVGSFLLQPCSCLLRDQVPGADLLMVADWRLQRQDQRVKDREVINLAVLADCRTASMASVGAGAEAASGARTVATSLSVPQSMAVDHRSTSTGLVRNLIWSLVSAVVAVAVASWVVRRSALGRD